VLAQRGVEVDPPIRGATQDHRGRVVIAGQHRSFGVGDDRSIDTAQTIEGGIGHNLPQEAPGAFADAILQVGRP
jgi:hypothetical protein